MSKNHESTINKYLYTQNRELSWLQFNKRVLEEAADETVPLLERLKFISIFASNLDEFFMVRVGSIFDLSVMAPSEIDNKTGMTPQEELTEIYRTIPGLIERKKQIYHTVCKELEKYGIQDISYEELTASEKSYIASYFSSHILPVLSPQIVDSHHPTPHLQNKKLYVASLLKHKDKSHSIGFIPVPDALAPIVMLPSEGRFIRIENIILQWAPTLYGKYKAAESCVLCATRNADISFDEEKFEDAENDFRSHVKKQLKKRAALSIVRLELDRNLSALFRKELLKIIHVENHQLYTDSTPLKMDYVFPLMKQLPVHTAKQLTYVPYEPKWPADLVKEHSIIEQIQEKDHLLFYPFDSVSPFIQLLNEAAERPDVLSIKITIYRLASTSKIVRALCRAAENGKEVVVLMELRARFDEANNIAWSAMLEEAGCQVIYGVENYKCHSKICLITMRNKGKIQYITQVGTGNYNEKTNAMYTDISVMTASNAIGEDGTIFFRNMLTGNLEGDYHTLLVSPYGIKASICQHIDEEITKGAEGYVCMKVNSVTERDVIDKLAEASRAGVEVHLIVRGICCIRPGVTNVTDNISVTSIVGRYLEHARIYCFGRGEDARYFISSADLMTRNLRRRVEIACPIYDEDIKMHLRHILSVQLADTAKSSFLLPDGSYIRCKDRDDTMIAPLDSQQEFMLSTFHSEANISQDKKNILQLLFDQFKKRAS